MEAAAGRTGRFATHLSDRKAISLSGINSFTHAFCEGLRSEILPEIERATIPIYGIQDEKIKRDRTGVLYKIADHHFILTASHGLRQIVEAKIPLYVLPNEADPEGPVVPLSAKYHTTEVDGRDIAVVHLPGPIAEQIASHKRFLQHNKLAPFSSSSKSLYVFFGYPEEWFGKVSTGAIRSRALHVICTEYTGDVTSGFLPRVHVALEFEKTGISLFDGEKKHLPDVHGISGCGIWRICDFTREGMEKCGIRGLRLVAVQHSWLPGRYVRGTRIEFALRLIAANYPELHPAMSLRYLQQ